MGVYGNGRYGDGLYGGGATAFSPCAPVQVWVWTRTGTLKGFFQGGSSSLVSVEFSHSERGCSDFTFEFAESVDISKSDTIRIKIFDVFEYLFCGVVRSVPILGSSRSGFVYTGFGYNDYLHRLNSGNLSYSTKTIAYVLDILLSTIIHPYSPINYNLGKVNPPAITLTSLIAHYSKISEVLDALLKIANSTGTEYLYGVDKEGDFFFRPRSSEVMATVFTGRTGDFGIPAYEPEDSSEEVTKLIVLKKDGTYWTTLTGAGSNDILEEKITGPDIADADLTLYATGILKDKERTLRSATIDWPLFVGSPMILADGWLRVISTVPPVSQITALGTAWGDGAWGDGYWGGSVADQFYNLDDTLAIKQVSYRIDGTQATRSIDLGAIPLRLEDAIMEINKKQAELVVSLGR